MAKRPSSSKQMSRTKKVRTRAYPPRGVRFRDGVFHTTLVSVPTQITIGAAATTLGALSFDVSQITSDSINGLLATFDQYRIDRVVVTFTPTQNVSSIEEIAGPSYTEQGLPMIYTCIDYNDATAPANLGVVVGHENVKYGLFNRAHNRSIIPKCATAVYKSAVATSYSSKAYQWLDTATASNTPHYGCKYAIVQPSTNAMLNNSVMFLTVKYYMSFRKVF